MEGDKNLSLSGSINLVVKVCCDEKFFPTKGNPLDAGYDLRSKESLTLCPGEIRVVCTGVRLQMPKGIYAKIYSRSGNSLKGLVVANAPGIIDTGYEGEIAVILQNTSRADIVVEKCDRVAQMTFERVIQVEMEKIGYIVPSTDRGNSGLGSTGSK